MAPYRWYLKVIPKCSKKPTGKITSERKSGRGQIKNKSDIQQGKPHKIKLESLKNCKSNQIRPRTAYHVM